MFIIMHVVEEALVGERDIDPEKRDDWIEVNTKARENSDSPKIGLAERAWRTRFLSRLPALSSPGSFLIWKLSSTIIHSRLNGLFGKPIVTVADVRECAGLTTKASNDLVKVFVERRILTETIGFRRNRVFVFSDYMNLFTD